MRSALAARAGFWAVAGCLLTLASAAGAAGGLQGGLAEFTQGRFAEALEDWQAEADSGDALGALYVGVLYDSGLGVTQSYGEAMRWYRRAADLGSAAGAFNVGVLHDSGLGTPESPVDAAAWYARAASAGYPRAEYNLAMLYETGSGVPRNRAHAMSLFRRAAAHGISAARAHLAGLGETVPDVKLALPEDGMRAFQQAQRILLTRGPTEAAQVAALFHRGAEHHNPLAEYDYGYCLEHGLGVSVDPAQALTWYQRAATDAADDGLRNVAKASVANLGGATAPLVTPPPAGQAPNDHPFAPPLTTSNDHHGS